MSKSNSAKYRRAYYKVRRDEIIDKLGGKCAICGSTENLEIDHIDPFLKTMNVSTKLMHCSKAKIDEELNNCQLLCHECHKKKSVKDISRKMSGERNPFYNKHGKDFPCSKPAIDLTTGKKFESATDLAKAYGLSPIKVAQVCRGIGHSVHGHVVKYI